MQHPGFLYFGMLLDASAQPVPYPDQDALPDVDVPPDVVDPQSPGAGGATGQRVIRGHDGRPAASGRLRSIAWLGGVLGLITGLSARVRGG
ncbi:MAG: hypothetical protein AB1627_08835 [Chloroflexota bacterium]